MNKDIREIGTRIWEFLKPEETPWRFVTSDGWEAAVGLPIGKLISGGGAGGHFFVQKDGDSLIYSMGYAAASIGLGVGTPVSVAHSEFDWPAQGWGKIWRIPMTVSDNPPSTFMGQCMMVSISGSVSPLVSSGLGAYGATLIFLGGNAGAISFPFCWVFYKYVGIIYGSFAATPGVGITAFAGGVGTMKIKE